MLILLHRVFTLIFDKFIFDSDQFSSKGLQPVLINLQICLKHFFLPLILTARDVLARKLSGFRNPWDISVDER